MYGESRMLTSALQALQGIYQNHQYRKTCQLVQVPISQHLQLVSYKNILVCQLNAACPLSHPPNTHMHAISVLPILKPETNYMEPTLNPTLHSYTLLLREGYHLYPPSSHANRGVCHTEFTIDTFLLPWYYTLYPLLMLDFCLVA